MKPASPLLGLTLSLAFSGAFCEEVKPTISAATIELAQKAQKEFEAGRYREAETLYREGLEQVPGNKYLLSNLATVHFRMGKFKLAEEELKKVLAAAPQDDFSHCTLGIVYYSQGKLDEAINELTKAIAINPKNATAHNYLGIVAAQKGWIDGARKEFEAARSLDPSLGDSTYRAPAASPPVGDFLTPLEKSRLKVPPSGYRPVLPPTKAPVRQ